jgi:DNA primase
MNGVFDDLRTALRKRVHIADLLQARGVTVRLNGRGGGTALCPFHDDHRPSLSIYRSPRDDSERFRCWSCGSRGDMFDFVQTLLDYPDHTATLRALATEHQLPWPEHQEAASSDILDRAAQFYAGRLTAPVLRYLADRGFPETFVRQRRIGYAPVSSSSRDLLVREIRGAVRSNGTQLLQKAIEAGLVVQDRTGSTRDFFASETHGYISFPNVVHGRVVDLQGRAYPTPARRNAYLNRPGAIRHLYNAGDAGRRSVILCEGIPDTLSVLVTGLKDTGACSLYGTGGWQPAWLPLFRRTARVYVALDRDATDRAITLARTFGTRGRVLIPPEDLGPKGDLNDWLRMGAKGDPAAFRSLLERALATSPTPWVLQIQRLPSDLAPWDLEDHPGARDLLCELGHQGPLSRDAHLRLLAERCGIALTTLQEAARELAQGADTDP